MDNEKLLYNNHLNYVTEVSPIVKSKFYEIWVPMI